VNTVATVSVSLTIATTMLSELIVYANGWDPVVYPVEAVIVNDPVPDPVGVPVSSPVGLSARPAGSVREENDTTGRPDSVEAVY
jgi:hypothetical protein